MSHALVLSVNGAAKDLVMAASMQGLDLSYARLASYCKDDLELDNALKLCKQEGVELKGTQHSALKQSRFEIGEINPMLALIMFFILALGLILLPIASVLGNIIMKLAGL